jgi:hypothetical protein
VPVTFTIEPDYYDRYAELAKEDDHIEMDIDVTGWSKSLRIRSLSVPQRELINRFAGLGESRDWVKFHSKTLELGLVRPRLTLAQASELVREHNGQPIEELSEAIWLIGGLSDVYQSYLEQVKKSKEAKADDTAAGTVDPA